MRHWLIKKLGGEIPWQGASKEIHIHVNLDNAQLERLINHAISGVFFKLHARPELALTRSKKKSENITVNQFQKKILKHQKPK